jgi:hypothetical protein
MLPQVKTEEQQTRLQSRFSWRASRVWASFNPAAPNVKDAANAGAKSAG